MRVTAHTKYYLKDGTLVAGTTTVTGILDKKGLPKWANELGLRGIDITKYVNEMADIGSLGHYIIECHLKKEEPDLKDYTENQITKARNLAQRFLSWKDENKFEFIKSELKMVSEQYRYGGTIDIYCLLNGKKTLIDIKTSKGIFDEHRMQVSAYKQLLVENGHPVEDVRIIRIGRQDNEGFEDSKVSNLDLHFKKFLLCLEIYNLDRELKK